MGDNHPGGAGPKQYRKLGGHAVLARATRPFLEHEAIDRVIVVIHPDDHALYADAMAHHDKLLGPVEGGATRQQSVLAGLEALAPLAPQRVLIHDAARPFASGRLISAMLDAVAPGAGAVPGKACTDTLKRAGGDGRIGQTVPRDGLFAVQTPQVFDFAPILAAHRDAAKAGVGGLSDDAAIAERAGITVGIVPFEGENMKITTASDLVTANRLLGGGASLADIRTGNGYDVHPLVPGDHVMLCGVRIAHERTLRGHSDADVGLHALTDALLATIADGDIGSHFPPSDPAWKGVSSDRFLAHAAERVRKAGGTINHLDVTLICEAPKIGPHRDAMRARIAEIAQIDLRRVSVKATTNEAIGFVGRREGIAAIATATAAFAFDPAPIWEEG